MLWLLRLLLPRPLGLTDVVQSIYGIHNSPDLPDYSGGAANSANSSTQAAIANQYLNRPNEVSPYGSHMWTQDGTINIPQVGGSPGFSIPQMTSTTSYTPAGQKLFDSETALKQNMLDTGQNVSAQVRNALGQPMDFSGAPQIMGQNDLNKSRDDVTNALFQRSMRLLQPQFDTESMQSKNELINKGFSVGNEGYNRELDNVSRRQGAQTANAADTAIAAGGAEQSRIAELNMNQRRQAISEILAQRQMPLSELSSLMTGAQPTAPSFQPFSTGANMQGANYLGADQAQGQAELTRYGLESQRSNMIHNGIMDIWKQAAGGSAGAAMSDRRAKEDIRPVGRLPSGIPVYEFRYIGRPELLIGVMADEVLPIIPEAVSVGSDGFYRVDYSKLN